MARLYLAFRSTIPCHPPMTKVIHVILNILTNYLAIHFVTLHKKGHVLSIHSTGSTTGSDSLNLTTRDTPLQTRATYAYKDRTSHVNHAPAALSPQTMYFSSPRTTTMYCPSGSCASNGCQDLISHDLPFHLCDPLDVQDHICNSLKDMFTKNRPSPTSKAIDQDTGFCKLYNLVKDKNLPNALGAIVIVPSGLNLRAWLQLLHGYHDNQLCHFLAFGWPIGYYSPYIPRSVEVNHPSATAHPTHVESFLEVEKQHRAIAGPFDDLPFTPWTRISPLMSRPKKGTDDRRIIVDLSFPHGEAVNTAIDITSYLGKDITYSLPTINDLITKLQLEGPGAYIWKAEIARVYCQLQADPIDAPLLGIKFNSKVFIDRCPPFGCRSSSSSAACQRVANALVFILWKQDHHCLAYLDDFSGCALNFQKAQAGYEAFLHLTQQLGLQLSNKKCVPPTTHIEWLGYQVNTVEMTIAIPPQKPEEILQECEVWEERSHVNKLMIQSLLGKLVHLSNCIQHGRKFLSRILGTLRAMENHTCVI